MAVAQLVERSLPIPEICGLNPTIVRIYLPIVNRKDENKEKEAGIWPIFKKVYSNKIKGGRSSLVV